MDVFSEVSLSRGTAHVYSGTASREGGHSCRSGAKSVPTPRLCRFDGGTLLLLKRAEQAPGAYRACRPAGPGIGLLNQPCPLPARLHVYPPHEH